MKAIVEFYSNGLSFHFIYTVYILELRKKVSRNVSVQAHTNTSNFLI